MKKIKMPILTLAVALVPAALAAQTVLNSVPMQGTMLMPKIAYHAGAETVTVDLSAINEAAQLTPLLVSHPTNCFDPAAPWYGALDPSQQGLAFSRRYGFTPDSLSDLLPEGLQIWIRKLSGPADLSFYSYSATPPIWTPIFGTAGTSNALYWNAQMFHPCVTAPPGTNNYSATFEAYLLDTASGQEVAGSSSGPFVLDWTDVPDGRPQPRITLTAAGQIVVTWSTNATNWTLLTAEAPNSTDWTTVTNEPVPLDGEAGVLLDLRGTSRFFRMKLVQ